MLTTDTRSSGNFNQLHTQPTQRGLYQQPNVWSLPCWEDCAIFPAWKDSTLHQPPTDSILSPGTTVVWVNVCTALSLRTPVEVYFGLHLSQQWRRGCNGLYTLA